ncbi:MAG TPA: BatA domain-containing protein [Thermoguttaceae bacterium]|nr:BatA domain-containing protein [Thermoguttaceae bacterium]
MPTFLHAPLLWGLLLAGVPVLIHLINLMHQRRVQWAAMEFLLASQRKNRAWVRLKELLLLLMRMAAIALVVLVVAQPLLRDELGGLLGGTKIHHVVLLDDSYSMTDRPDGGDVMDEAKAVVDRIATTAAEHVNPQRFTLLRFSRAAGEGSRVQPDFLQESIDRDFVARLRTAMKPIHASQTAAGPAEAIRAVAGLLGDAKDQTRIVYLVSDFRANQWERAEELRSLLADLTAKNVAIRLVNCTDRQRPNLAVTRLAPVSGTRAAGISMFMEVEVGNHGTSPARDVSVVLDEDGRRQPAVKIREIPPRESVRERFQITFATAGLHRLAARLESDAVELDNVRHAVVEVPLEVPVLVVDGSAEGEGALFLGAALAPGGAVRTGIQPRVETPAFLNLHSLDDYRAIYLTDVEHLDPAAVDSLSRWVADGGGLGIFLGPRCRAGFLNENLWRDGAGLMPIPVTGEAELPVDRLEKVPDVVVTDHPMFRVLAGKDNSFLATINVNRYFGVPRDWRPDQASTARVIARLRNGEPLVVERRVGKGLVIAWLTTAAPLWNNAGANPSFPVIVQEMQAYLDRGNANETASLTVETPLEIILDAARHQSRVQLVVPGEKGPDETTIDATPATEGMLGVRFLRTDKAGIYEARIATTTGATETRRWAVNVDPREGDLARLDAARLSTRLAGVKYTYHDSRAFGEERQEAAGYNLGDALLGLLVLWLAGEQLLAWSCSYHPRRDDAGARVVGGGAA